MAIKKRFTFFTDDYPAVTCDSCYEDQNENYTGPAIDRLAEYEATGLMPAEVAALTQELKYAKQQCRGERRWIPVTERLPESEGTYLVYTKRGSVYASHFYEKKVFRDDYVREQQWSQRGEVKVTHWMPLPEPPKEGTP